ncbi:hypothetical protein TNCV_4256311 [Trichonephila clavipes]|nr:hypothetical protein TNCV_4256311 [Trichonephila clavipes]
MLLDMNNADPTSSEKRNILKSMRVPIDDVVSRVFLESSALGVVAIHSGMAAEWLGLVSSHAKPVEVYSQKAMSSGRAGSSSFAAPDKNGKCRPCLH